ALDSAHRQDFSAGRGEQDTITGLEALVSTRCNDEVAVAADLSGREGAQSRSDDLGQGLARERSWFDDELGAELPRVSDLHALQPASGQEYRPKDDHSEDRRGSGRNAEGRDPEDTEMIEAVFHEKAID